ncbi:FG-GAP repeat domain-containing protein [Flavimaricola marinus]|uniref:FG-GAP repeat protein n=1 Tax=Flavimaricola marinus TaxID=1819565 RepID=A0A238LJJ7_9RHOB|nr:VCBS repeat-containing protein [Flavimaricola marinus]SMY09887.1 hypothetical protein LOM8899_04059 [Flavimaricola marinus]
MRFPSALLVFCLWGGQAGATPTDSVVSARYTEPTTRYDHGILGDAIEWGAVGLVVDRCARCAVGNIQTITLRLPDSRVFEDVAPRLVDMDGDGTNEVVVVETDIDRGARLAIYGGDGGLVAATPFIGQTHRWLAPIGAADLDGDGQIEVAYIDRPHLARTLRVWRFDESVLTEIAAIGGLTNHRIGEADIAGGIRECGQGPEMIVASADWRHVVAVRFQDGELVGREIGAHKNRASFADALACRF